jgi:FkbM family methyltransferase
VINPGALDLRANCMSMIRRLRRLARRLLDIPASLRRWLHGRRVYTLTHGPAAGRLFCPAAAEAGYATGENELPVQEALSTLLRQGDVFFDVGANVGLMTVVGASLVGESGRVFAFEPVSSNLAVIRRNLRLNHLRQVEVVAKAVSDRPGHEQLVLARYCGGAALAVADAPPDATGSIEVPVTSIDEFVASGAPAPHVVKIDVEGAEIQVLRGMGVTLRQHSPAVLFEVDGPDEQTLARRISVCREFLEANGYRLSKLPDSYPAARWRVAHYIAQRPGVPLGS